MIDWLRSFRSASRARHAPVAEGMEPRLLFSADLAGGLLLGADAADGAEHRTLTAHGEYASADATAATTYAALPMSFEANAGQAGEGIDFIAHGGGYGIALGDGHAWLALATESGARTVQLQLVGAREGVQAEGEGLLATRSNYLVGGDASRWATNLANYQAVAYHGVYDGIDVRYYGNQRQLEYDFIVAAGADAGQIRLRFDGAQASLDANGDLLLHVEGTDSELRFKAPVSYQRGDDGALQAVASAYAIHADGSIGFVLGAYDRGRELVIDPVLDYATYFGGAASEIATDVAVGADGFVYITGRTTSASFPGLANELPGQGTRGNGDIFVAKLTADLSQVVWSTRIGGSADEQANAIAVDSNGNVAVTGWTKSTNFPTLNAADSTMGTGLLVPVQDAVIFKLDADGGLVFSTYFGGNEDTDSGNAVAFDAAGNVYAAGQASSGGLVLPILSPLLGSSDNAFINKYSPTGTLLYDQLLGGTGVDYATGLAVDAAGNAYVVGSTRSGSLALDSDTITMNGDDAGLSGATDGFLVRLDGAGNPVYATFVGGGDNDAATGVAIAADGQVYVVGETRFRNSGNLTTTPGAYQTTSNADNNDTIGFLRLYDTNQDGAGSLLYSTLLGHEDGDRPSDVAVMDGRAVIVGRSNSDSFPTTTGADNENNALFVVVIDPAGQGSLDLVYGTFHGKEMTAGGVAVHGRDVYVSGGTAEAGYAMPGAHQGTPSNTDALVAAFNMNTAPVLVGVNTPGAVEEDSGRTSITVAGLLDATDADGDVAGIAITGLDAAHGTWQYTLDGSTWIDIGAVSAGAALLLPADGIARIGFTPNADYNGTIAQALSFRAWDRSAGTAGTRVDTARNGGSTAFSADTGSFDMVVTPVNDAPTTDDVILADVAEDGALVITPADLLREAADVENDALAVTGLVADNGTVTANGDGTWTFRPAADYHGDVTFTYTISDGRATTIGSATLTVTPVNDAPTTSPVTLADLQEDGIRVLTPADLLQEAEDVDGDALTVTNLVATNGTVTANGDGTWTFRPATEYSGPVNFTYTISDGVESITGRASLAVTPVNDAPVAVLDRFTILEDEKLVIAPEDLYGNDVDAEGAQLSIVSVGDASGGTVRLNGNGINGTIHFDPDPDFQGTASFTYVVSDGVNEVTGTVIIRILPVNDAPTTSPVVLPDVEEDGSLVITPGELLQNAADAEGNTLAITSLSASNGTVTLNDDGTWTFRPAADFLGSVTFTYGITDGTATVSGYASLTVTPVNDAPTTSPVTLADVAEDGSLVIAPADLLRNAGDVDGDALAVTGLGASNGTVTANGDGTWTFRPAADFHGAVTFTYTVTDGTADVAGSASLVVTPVNDAPTSTPVTLADLEEDGALVITPADLLRDAADVDGDALTVTGLAASNGTVTANGDGTWTFRPDANFHGNVTFTYGISDGRVTTAATADLTVTPVDDAPVGNADQLATDAGRPLTIAPGALLANDTDVEGSPLFVSAVTAGTGGTVTLNADGSITFRPDAGFAGTAGFTYTVSDGSLVTVVPVSIDVAALPQAPSPPAGTEPTPPAPPPAQEPEVPVPAPPPAAESPAPAPVESGAAPAIPPVTAAPAAQPEGESATPQRAPRPTPSLQEALGPAPESPIATLNASAMSFGAPAAQLALQAEGGRVVDSVVFDRAGLQLIAAQGTDFALAQFGIEGRSGTSHLAEFQRSIRSPAFEQELDRLREAVREELDFDKSVTISVVSVSLGLSFVYVLWLIRGGVLLGSYLSALPAWRMLDPLPVLARSDEEGEEDDEPLDADGPGSRHTLRGFG